MSSMINFVEEAAAAAAAAVVAVVHLVFCLRLLPKGIISLNCNLKEV